MLWVLIFVGIALVGLGLVVAYGVWLTHKVSDLLSEVRVLTDRGGQIADAFAEITGPQRLTASQVYAGSSAFDEADDVDDGVR